MTIYQIPEPSEKDFQQFAADHQMVAIMEDPQWIGAIHRVAAYYARRVQELEAEVEKWKGHYWAKDSFLGLSVKNNESLESQLAAANARVEKLEKENGRLRNPPQWVGPSVFDDEYECCFLWGKSANNNRRVS